MNRLISSTGPVSTSVVCLTFVEALPSRGRNWRDSVNRLFSFGLMKAVIDWNSGSL